MFKLATQLARSAAGVASQILGNSLIFLIMARGVAPAEFGRFAAIYAICGTLTLMVDYGYPQRFLRDFPAYVAEFGGVPSRTRYLKLGLTLISALLAAAIGLASDFDPILLAIAWCGLTATSWGTFFGTLLRATQHHGRDALHLFGASLVAAGYAAVILAMGSDTASPFATAFVLLGGTYLGLSALQVSRLKLLVADPAPWRGVRAEILPGLSYASDVFIARAYGLLDVVILAAVASDRVTGLYQSATKLMQLALPLAQVFNNVLLPRFVARQARTGSAQHPFRATIALVGGAGFVLMLCFVFLGPMAIDLALPADYHAIKPMAPVLGLIVQLRFLSAAHGILLVSMGRQRTRMLANALSLAIFLPVAAYASAHYGAWGMLWAVAFSAAVTTALYALSAYRKSRP